MKAVVFSEYGGPDKLHVAEIPDPKPRRNEVVVQVKATALNHLDIWMRRGMGIEIPMPHISGSDICGIVVGKGEDVRDVHMGDRVIIAPGQSCGNCDRCYTGRDSECSKYQIFGFQTQGGYAEYAVTEERHVIPVSQTLGYEEWAAIPLVFLTAWHMLFTRARLQPGETVLVHGCGSGVGSAAIQLADMAGARVITTSASDDKLRRARRELPVAETVNYEKGDVAQAVQEWTSGRGVDVVFDHIGPTVWPASIQSLTRGGRLVTCGATTGADVSVSLREMYMRQVSLLGSFMGSRAELARVIEAASNRRIKPVVDKIFPMGQAREAHKRMQARENFGKIVLSTNPPAFGGGA